MPLVIMFYHRFKCHLGQFKRGWNFPAERPKINPNDYCSEKTEGNFRSELTRDCLLDNIQEQAYDMMAGENESPIPVPEFLTGRMPSRSHLNQSHDELNPLPDTTIPEQERTAPATESDPISRLADVLTNMQNRPTAQQLTIRPVSYNTTTFDGKSEKFELLEDLFHTMIEMLPDTSEQMKINHFHSLL